ncbi:MAG: preprotein translocase subunit SecA [Odoribacter sp.]|nr:preprotein translocase subunit SecA [Odoribacter sp.]
MSLESFLKSIFGSKAQRDRKHYLEFVEKNINPLAAELEQKSNDELRDIVAGIRADIRGAIKPDEDKIAELKEKIETLPLDERQPLWDEIDHLEKNIKDTLEAKLDEHLPMTFAALRDAARRFAKNETVEVTATDLDRDLAGRGKDFLTIDGDKAIYKNHWIAGGNEVTWDMIHYDVQMVGGKVLNEGKIAEMATGEGKTLVATLPVFLRSLTGRGVHVVTVNDYLAKRDSEWMGPLYQFLGSTIDCIDKHQPNTAARRNAYNCDITYGTNNEFGFDYLRDNMAMAPEDMVQRGHYYAIVDEVDSVLIDDARTPLIISGPVPKGEEQYFDEYKSNVEKVVKAQRQLVNEILVQAKEKLASEDKDTKKEGALLLFRAYKGLPKYPPLIKFLSQDGMKNILLETEAHYLQDNAREMPIVTDPLYFVIDEKNRSVELTDKGLDELTGKIADPTFFVLPDIASRLSELEHVADKEERQARKDEAMQDYAVKAERVHTVTQLLKAYTLFDKDIEYVIDDNKIKIVDEQTGRIMEGRRYSDGLHQAIEAKEGVKVEAATQTFATITLQNYFRMYHKLAGMTGTAVTEAGEFWDVYKLEIVEIPTNRPVVRVDMNDRVYKTKKEKYKAVIAEIERLNKIGRPVLVGTTSVEISELLSKMLNMRKIKHNVLNAKLHQREAEIVALAGLPGAVTIATNMAGRGTDIKLPKEVKELQDMEISKNPVGGLAIIGTERHESRRVDRQLRGRAGRQGDPGSSVFFVSFEDQLMRLFATDRVMKMLDTFGLKEDEMIEHKMVNNAIEKAQRRVEENNFGIRKRLVEYDDVMNKQRNYIYTRRQHALKGERIGIDIANMLYDTVEVMIDQYENDYASLSLEIFRTYSIEPPFKEEEYAKLDRNERVEQLHEAALSALDRKNDKIREIAIPVINNLLATSDYRGKIIVPIADGKRVFNLRVDLETASRTEGRSIIKEWQQALSLVTIDELWMSHLRELDQLRQSVQNASYEQKDPLVIYKVEAFHLFQDMLSRLNTKMVSTLMRAAIPVREPAPESTAPANDQSQASEQPKPKAQPELKQAAPEMPRNYNYRTSKAEAPGSQAEAQRQAASAPQGEQQKTSPIVAQPRVGRNDPCPCGSGKKFKNCHGAQM